MIDVCLVIGRRDRLPPIAGIPLSWLRPSPHDRAGACGAFVPSTRGAEVVRAHPEGGAPREGSGCRTAARSVGMDAGADVGADAGARDCRCEMRIRCSNRTLRVGHANQRCVLHVGAAVVSAHQGRPVCSTSAHRTFRISPCCSGCRTSWGVATQFSAPQFLPVRCVVACGEVAEVR